MVFRRKQRLVQHVAHADLIDLLLDADEATRRQLISHGIQNGTFDKSEADDLMARVARLKRAAGPRPSEPKPEPEPQSAWGIIYP